MRWWRARGRSMRSKLIRLKTLLVTRVAPAVADLIVGLRALLLSIGSNNRIYVGLVLMGVVSPLSSCIYMLFDRGVYIQEWYHVNYFHLFLLLAPYLSIFFCFAGVFLLFPEGSKRAYALIVPAGFTLGKIFWLIQIKSNAEYWSVVPWFFVLVGLLTSAVLFLMLDWMAHNKFHRVDAFEARMDLLCANAKGFDDETFKRLATTVYREKKAFQKQY